MDFSQQTKRTAREFGTSADNAIITRYIQFAVPVQLPNDDVVWAIQTAGKLMRITNLEYLAHTKYTYNCISDFEEPRPADNPETK